MSGHVKIRLATLKDAEAIALESMTEIEHNLDWHWTPQRVCDSIADPELVFGRRPAANVA